MHDLDEPDETGHGQGARKVGRYEEAWAHWLLAENNRDRPLLGLVAFLRRQEDFAAEITDIIWSREACIRKTMPLESLGKNGKSESDRLIKHIADDVNEVVLPAKSLTMPTTKHEGECAAA